MGRHDQTDEAQHHGALPPQLDLFLRRAARRLSPAGTGWRNLALDADFRKRGPRALSSSTTGFWSGLTFFGHFVAIFVNDDRGTHPWLGLDETANPSLRGWACGVAGSRRVAQSRKGSDQSTPPRWRPTATDGTEVDPRRPLPVKAATTRDRFMPARRPGQRGYTECFRRRCANGGGATATALESSGRSHRHA